MQIPVFFRKECTVFLAFAGFAMAVFPVPLAAQVMSPMPRSVTPLGAFTPMAINDSGQVIGSDPDGNFLRQPDGSYTLLDRNPQYLARAINAHGQIAGFEYVLGVPRGRLWTPGEANGAVGQHTIPGTLGGALGLPLSINDAGQITGTSSLAGSANGHVFLWQPTSPGATTGRMFDLLGIDGQAGSINRMGQVVGWAADGAVDGGFLWTPHEPNGASGQWVWLPAPPDTSLDIRDINNIGQVVGAVTTFDEVLLVFTTQAFVWTPDVPNGPTGTLILLPNLPGKAQTQAIAINDLGQVVGRAYELDPFDFTEVGERAVVWQAGTVSELTPYAESSRATDINQRGQVIVATNDFGGDGNAYLVEVPPPTTTALDTLETFLGNLAMAGELSEYEANQLAALLESAVRSVERGNVGAAMNRLAASRNRIDELVIAGRLTSSFGNTLGAQADAIIEAIRR